VIKQIEVYTGIIEDARLAMPHQKCYQKESMPQIENVTQS
jgi:hypothetical protein